MTGGAIGDSVPIAEAARLRRWSERDVPSLEQAFQDPEIRRWTPVGQINEPQMAARAFVANVDQEQLTRVGNFALEVEGGLAGAFGTVSIPTQGEVELAYWVVRSFRGRGFGGLALTAFSALLLREPDVIGLRLEIASENVRSIACAVRAGYVMSSAHSSYRPGHVVMVRAEGESYRTWCAD